jgi:hypothetical protein
MANTHFSGPVYSENGFIGDVTGDVVGNVTGTATGVSGSVVATTLVLPQATVENLEDIAGAYNLTGKVVGKGYYVLSTKDFYVAQGTTAAATWVSLDGTTTITPA